MTPEQLTAWALNELSAEERAQIDAMLQASPEEAAKAAELQHFCQFVGEHLVDDDASLDAERRAALQLLPIGQVPNVVAFDSATVPAKMNGHAKPASLSHAPRLTAWVVGVAACLAFGMFVMMNQTLDDARIVREDRGAEPAPFAGSESIRVQPRVEEVAKVAPSAPLASAPAPSKLAIATGEAKLGDLPASPEPTVVDAGRSEMKLPKGTKPASTTLVGAVIAEPRRRAEHTYADRSFLPPQIPVGMGVANTERYGRITENKFFDPSHDPLSTFSIDVDTASYANVRRFLNAGQRPPTDAVRLEELINYFPYDYEAPAKDSAQPFSVSVDLAEAPWAPTHRLARIGIKGREVGMERQQANFVFLVDVSGSMNEGSKLPLVKRSLEMLTAQIKDDDRVAIVTYAGESGVALESTAGKDRQRILAAVNALHAGGSTNGASGISLAYAEAQSHFIQEGINRVILCTDGDFNVGVSSPEELEKLIKAKAKSGVFLSVLGFGSGNLKDQQMETLADKGNGNYAYIDSLSEARKVLVEQMSGTLITIAKDVKIQVEFNPAQVRSYRLLGYENRLMATEDFNNDRKDAGEIGAGHTVTALYEIVPMDAPLASDGPLVDALKYQPKPENKLPHLTGVPPPSKLAGLHDEVMTVKLRYKEPDGQLSKLIELPAKDVKTTLKDAPKDFQFAAAVASLGMMLRDSEAVGEMTYEDVRALALAGKGEDKLGYRGEFIQLIDKANGSGSGDGPSSSFNRLFKPKAKK